MNNALLLRFLKEYRDWARADAPQGLMFFHWRSNEGLCGNLFHWLWQFPDEVPHAGVDYQFRQLLTRDFGFNSYPFGRDTYSQEAMERTHHRNRDRLAWVDKLIEELSHE